ncbi:MFS transporter [Bradyrhizobium sp. CCBAU 51745]|uniref:MFS transporter n=1 Tax=Bradyrhizobium sp. CCBAU 51745 TaxID=1325099 RepID=UPI002306AA3D|nr:MFS transporter [Bradyrhizobium sp. CCBAU 51745]MDA9443942.1 MFS transporter [Bradyrhizobium sp. CCBAU 51745]
MTSEAAPAAIVPPLRAWDSLLWTVPLTALWTGLLYAQPALLQSGLPALAARLATYGLIVLGAWLGLERTDLAPAQRRTTWLAIMVPFTLWAAAAWSAAINGVFRTGYSQLPLLPAAIFLPVVIGAPLLLLSKRVGQLLDAMPTNWLVALQLYRIVGSQWLAYWLLGQLPGLWALPAGSGDVLTGLFAVTAAMALASGTAEGRKAAILWNIFGIADFVVAITLGMLITPGPFQLIIPQGPNVGLDNYPTVLTPAFVVPSSILLHALSLRQLRRRSRARDVAI